MNAKQKLLCDAGVIVIAGTVALGTCGAALGKKPALRHPMPHNFVKAHNAT